MAEIHDNGEVVEALTAQLDYKTITSHHHHHPSVVTFVQSVTRGRILAGTQGFIHPKLPRGVPRRAEVM